MRHWAQLGKQAKSQYHAASLQSTNTLQQKQQKAQGVQEA
jgi:hypothetical protein